MNDKIEFRNDLLQRYLQKTKKEKRGKSGLYQVLFKYCILMCCLLLVLQAFTLEYEYFASCKSDNFSFD